MKVRMLRTESGRYDGFDQTGTGSYHCLTGHEYDVPDALGAAWVKANVAKKVRPAPAPQKTTSKKKSEEVRNGD